MSNDDLTDIKVAVAVLDTQYKHIDEKLTAHGLVVTELNSKFDKLLTEMTEQRSRSKITSRVLTVLSHGATMAGAVIIAKLFHEPVQLP